MTAPAVVRRWAGAPSSGVGRDAPGSRPPAALVGLGSLIRERLAAARRVAPLGAVLATALLAQAAVAPHLAVRRVAPDVLAVATERLATRSSCAGQRATQPAPRKETRWSES